MSLKDLRTKTEALSISGPDAVRDVKVRPHASRDTEWLHMLYVVFVAVLSFSIEGKCHYGCV